MRGGPPAPTKTERHPFRTKNLYPRPATIQIPARIPANEMQAALVGAARTMNPRNFESIHEGTEEERSRFSGLFRGRSAPHVRIQCIQVCTYQTLHFKQYSGICQVGERFDAEAVRERVYRVVVQERIV